MSGSRTVMIGGEYGKVSSMQREAITHVLPVIAAAMKRTNNRSVVLGDYGCADGLTSKIWVKAALEETTAPLITVVHNDLPCNDWAAFLENTSDLAAPNLLALISPVSFYARAVQPSSVSLGVAGFSLHWLKSTVPVPGCMFGQLASDCPEKQRWSESSTADLKLVIRQRIDEMEPGATFVMTMPSTKEGTSSEALVYSMEKAHHALHERGYLPEDLQLSVPEHFRTVEEILAVLNSFSEEIVDIKCELQVKANPTWTEIKFSPNPQSALASRSASFARAIHHSILKQQLEEKLGEEKAVSALSAYWAEVERNILQDTQPWEKFAFTTASFRKRG